MPAHNARSFFSHKWIIVGILTLILLSAFAFFREYLRNVDITAEQKRLEQENASLQNAHLAALDLIAQLSTETAVEYQSRTKFNLAKEGETLYVVGSEGGDVYQEESPIENPSLSVGEDPALSNPVKWFYYFFAVQKNEGERAL